MRDYAFLNGVNHCPHCGTLHGNFDEMVRHVESAHGRIISLGTGAIKGNQRRVEPEGWLPKGRITCLDY